MVNEYITGKKGSYQSTSSNSNYASSNNNSSRNSSLYVIQDQVKQSPGICTCKKKGPCRGTCR